METLLALEMVRVTEAAGNRFRPLHGPRREGRGGPRRDRGDAHRRWTRWRCGAPSSSARASATRRRCSGSASRSARRGPGQVAIDIAVDPLEGTNLVAHGQANAITVLAASERGRPAPRPRHLPREAVRGSRRGGPRRHPPAPDRERAGHRRRAAARCAGHHHRHPRAAAPRGAHRGGAGRPARASSSSPTATSRRPSAAPCRAPASTA